MLRRTVWAAGAVAGLLAASVGPAAAAPAPAADTCPYPYVCLFKNGVRIGQFQDVTTGYQALPSRPTGTAASPLHVINTRNDDVAYLRWSTGSTVCLPPKTENPVIGTLTDIRISSSATC
ncbi:hypothetical protein ACWHAO_21155 [Streptomyces albidoflavus]